MGHIFCFFMALIYGAAIEWGVHKYLFHGWGKKKYSIFAFHLRDHHVTCLKNKFHDPKISPLEWGGVIFLIFIHSPILWWSPSFFAGATLYAFLFGFIHNISHKYPEWTKKWFPWHYDHHMKYQNDNMNVVLPIFDYVMGTRKKFLDKSL